MQIKIKMDFFEFETTWSLEEKGNDVKLVAKNKKGYKSESTNLEPERKNKVQPKRVFRTGGKDARPLEAEVGIFLERLASENGKGRAAEARTQGYPRGRRASLLGALTVREILMSRGTKRGWGERGHLLSRRAPRPGRRRRSYRRPAEERPPDCRSDERQVAGPSAAQLL